MKMYAGQHNIRFAAINKEGGTEIELYHLP